MLTSIKEAKRFEDLMSLESHNMPYFFDRIFSAEGWGAKSLSKKKFKLLKNIDKKIQEILNEGEKVYFIGRGVQLSHVEEFFIGGAYSHHVNRKAIIFTTQRILQLQISGSDKPLILKSQIQYSAITKISRTLFGNCRIELQNGKKLIFAYLPKKDRKFMEKEIEELTSKQAFPPSVAKGLENLCPYCKRTVEGLPESCPHCFKAFKSASKAGWLSFIFPGLGDFYLGYRGFAVLEIIIAAIIWLGVLSGMIRGASDTSALTVTALILFVFMHGINAVFTRQIGKKGIYPAEK